MVPIFLAKQGCSHKLGTCHPGSVLYGFPPSPVPEAPSQLHLYPAVLLIPSCEMPLGPHLGGKWPLLSTRYQGSPAQGHEAANKLCEMVQSQRSYAQPAWSPLKCSEASLCICVTVLVLMTKQLVFLQVSCEGLYSLEHTVNTPFDLHHSLSGSRLYLLHSIKSVSQRQKQLTPLWPLWWAFPATKL